MMSPSKFNSPCSAGVDMGWLMFELENNEPMEWKVAKLSCLSPIVLNPHFPGAPSHHFTYQNQSVMLKTHLPCAIGVRRFEFCGLINVFFLRGNLQLFPGLFPWNLQLSSRFFLKPLQWSLHPHICPLYPHYIPIASTKTHHFPPKKKRFPGGRAFGSFGADVSRASRVALEGSRCMDGSVANMYVAKGYAEGKQDRTFPKAFSLGDPPVGNKNNVGKTMP